MPGSQPQANKHSERRRAEWRVLGAASMQVRSFLRKVLPHGCNASDLNFRPMNLTSLKAISVTSLLLLCVRFSACGADHYKEPLRPQFHFTPPSNWINDPNGMVFLDGEYHLFFQHNPFGDKWGHMSWGHAVSHDLTHWVHLPLALGEDAGVMVFSGSAVVDHRNTSGFGKDGKPPLVAIYTGHYTTRPLQNQQIAYSNDRGRTWTRYAGNPVLDIGEKDFRDPKVSWHEPTGRWLMAVSWPIERKVRFFSSPNLKDWTHLSDFGPAGSTNGIWECPDLFPLSIAGKTKWILIVNVGSGAPAGGSGCQYFVGDFDGVRFRAEGRASGAMKPAEDALWIDHGPDFYAAVSWNDVPKRDGRRLWLGWMSNWNYANDVPTSPWRSAMTIPRELSLYQSSEGIRLKQSPVRELTRLRGKRSHFGGGSIEEANDWLQSHSVRGDNLEFRVEFDPLQQGVEGIKLFKSDREELFVGLDRTAGRVFVDRTKSGNTSFHPKFSGVHSVALPLPQARVSMRIFVDASSVEVFVNEGERALTELAFPSSGSRNVEFVSSNVHARIAQLDVWYLKSIW